MMFLTLVFTIALHDVRTKAVLQTSMDAFGYRQQENNEDYRIHRELRR